MREGQSWMASQMQGTLGSSDVSGQLTFDQSAAVAMLTGKLQSRLLDFEDLGPVIGMKVAARGAETAGTSTPGKAATAGRPASATRSAGMAKAAKASSPTPAQGVANPRRVLPTAVLDLAKLKSMNADVTYAAASIRHVSVYGR